MKQRRIACLTYHKHPGEDWSHEEFVPTEVRLASGQRTTIQLAERGTRLARLSDLKVAGRIGVDGETITDLGRGR